MITEKALQFIFGEPENNICFNGSAKNILSTYFKDTKQNVEKFKSKKYSQTLFDSLGKGNKYFWLSDGYFMLSVIGFCSVNEIENDYERVNI